MGTAAVTGSCPAPADTPRITYGAADTGKMPAIVPTDASGIIFGPVATAGIVPDTVIKTELDKLGGTAAILCAGVAETSAQVGAINDDT